MMMEKLMALSFSLMILGQAMALRLYAGTWIVPGCIFGLFWFLYTFVPLLFLWDVPANVYAVAYIFVACLVFSLGALPFRWRLGFEMRAKNAGALNYGSPFMLRAFYVTSMITAVSLIIDLHIQGVSLKQVVTNPLAIAGAMTAKRYGAELVPNLFAQLSFVLQYPSAILGGFIYSTREVGVRRWSILLLTFLPSILAMVLQGAKGNLFLVLVLFWAATLVCKVNRGKLALFGVQDLRRAAPYAAVIFGLVLLAMASRGLLDSSGDVKAALVRLVASYATAHMYAFSDWFAHLVGHGGTLPYVDNLGDYGIYTFTPVARLLGNDTPLPAGVYEEYFAYGDVIQTNIYTMFRGLINDFGLSGSLIVMLLAGSAIHVAYWIFLMSKSPSFSTSIFIHSIGYFYTSFIISLLIWNSIYASILITALLCFFGRYFGGGEVPAPCGRGPAGG
ncbi:MULTISPECIES: O-antigen polymerase [unclassified Cupriavidus]|uniref:O-antigen polymerase n=1 Tax=unclassified Cupriavidus TaxID=2640874 RepID=UPI0010F4A2E3|nr:MULTISPECIES: O-antigen polymerase [unclassified Cupriavidus]MWL88211.1 oligosaccharide repeat unit polymerase [Cupriavidus sp. SW-Y-13]